MESEPDKGTLEAASINAALEARLGRVLEQTAP